MKVAVVGGRGNIGQEIALGLIREDAVAGVLLADLEDDPDGLRYRLRKNQKVSLRRLDARDPERLAAALRGVRVVVNCASPFAESVCPVARAAVAAGADYLDVCDDHQATARLMASDLDQAAKRAGVSLVTGMGSDPGTNNLLALWYARKLDTVEEIALFWAVDFSELTGAALAHGGGMLAGRVPQYLASRLQYVEGGEGEETVEFMAPIGACRVRYVGHPQPLTLPRRVKGLARLTVKGAILPAWADHLLMAQKQAGLLSETPVQVRGVKVKPLDLAPALWRELAAGQAPGPGVSGLKVVVKGERRGRPRTYTAELNGAMGEGTGLPAALAVRMLLGGEITARGLLAPEDAIDPDRFVALLLQSGACIRHTCQETTLRRAKAWEARHEGGAAPAVDQEFRAVCPSPAPGAGGGDLRPQAHRFHSRRVSGLPGFGPGGAGHRCGRQRVH